MRAQREKRVRASERAREEACVSVIATHALTCAHTRTKKERRGLREVRESEREREREREKRTQRSVCVCVREREREREREEDSEKCM